MWSWGDVLAMAIFCSVFAGEERPLTFSSVNTEPKEEATVVMTKHEPMSAQLTRM